MRKQVHRDRGARKSVPSRSSCQLKRFAFCSTVVPPEGLDPPTRGFGKRWSRSPVNTQTQRRSLGRAPAPISETERAGLAARAGNADSGLRSSRRGPETAKVAFDTYPQEIPAKGLGPARRRRCYVAEQDGHSIERDHGCGQWGWMLRSRRCGSWLRVGRSLRTGAWSVQGWERSTLVGMVPHSRQPLPSRQCALDRASVAATLRVLDLFKHLTRSELSGAILDCHFPAVPRCPVMKLHVLPSVEGNS